MKFRRAKSFNDDLASLDPCYQKAVNREAFEELTQAIQGNRALAGKYHLKRMEGKDGFFEGHLKPELCFVYSLSREGGETVCTFLYIGWHDIYKRVH